MNDRSGSSGPAASALSSIAVRRRIVELMGDVPRLEVFARDKGYGWDATGLELDGVDIRDFLNR